MLYYTIIYIILLYIIILFLLLYITIISYYTLSLFCSIFLPPLQSSPPLPLPSPTPSSLYHPILSSFSSFPSLLFQFQSSSIIIYVSILTYAYLYCTILFPSSSPLFFQSFSSSFPSHLSSHSSISPQFIQYVSVLT